MHYIARTRRRRRHSSCCAGSGVGFRYEGETCRSCTENMLRTVRRKRRSRRCSAVKWARQTTRLRRCLLPLADQKRLPNIAGQVETRIMTQTINSFHQADHVRPRVASSVEDATPETTHPSAAPETTRPRPPPQHRRPRAAPPGRPSPRP